MVDFIANERATSIRYPSTANLMIDSADRPTNYYSSPWDFQITKNNSIMNGFFTRIGTTEVVLEWCEPNIYTDGSNNSIVVDISGATGLAFSQAIVLPEGFYTLEECIDQIVIELNDLSGTTGSVFTAFNQLNGQVVISSTTAQINISIDTGLSERLDLPVTGLIPQLTVTQCADLRKYRYLDFTSSQLTYNQEVKDNSTANIQRDVLCRWYMAWDTEPVYDTYGYPILMGYRKFVVRRLFNPPKQIKWSANQPLGNIAFQVYGNDQQVVSAAGIESNFLMTLQISEV